MSIRLVIRWLKILLCGLIGHRLGPAIPIYTDGGIHAGAQRICSRCRRHGEFQFPDVLAPGAPRTRADEEAPR